MENQDHVSVDPERLNPGVEVSLVIDEAVAAVRGRPGIAHADIVARQATSERQQVGDDVSPQVGRCGIVMQEDDRVAPADIDIGHLRAEHRHVFPIGDVFGRNGGLGHLQAPSRRRPGRRRIARSGRPCKHLQNTISGVSLSTGKAPA
jgi:hypothetical protein